MAITRSQMNRQLRMGGGIMSLSEDGIGGGIIKGVDMGSRTGFFNPIKSIKKAVKGVAKGVKDVVKSDIGKAALLAGGAYYLGGLGGATGFGRFAPSALKTGLLGTIEAGTGLYGGGVLSGLMNTGVGQA